MILAGIAALRYQSASFDTRVGKIMGRQMVSGDFLRAWIACAGADPLTGWTHSKAEADAFARHARELGAAMPIIVAGPGNDAAVAEAGALLLGDPVMAPFAWQRRHEDETRYSLVGITHSINSHGALDAIADLLIAPTQHWDALICTSRAVKAVVQTVLQEQGAYLAQRLGAQRGLGPELPVIPLGLACDAFAFSAEDRARWRGRLGLAAEDVAVVQLGRIAFHAKAHPIPLYHALAEAGAQAGRRPHLVFAGLFANPGQERLYRALGDHFADRVATHFVDGHDPGFRSVLAAGDIFALLADNMQESFGVAPVEAMAAGLPAVVSDWDGFRDTVEHGVTGFRIDTLQPPPGAGALLAMRHDLGADDYDVHAAGVAQSVAVDIAGAARAFARLIADPGLRRTMGAAGRARARALYDWPVVIAAYRALLAELAGRRAAGQVRAPRRAGGPARPGRGDPFATFASYPSAALGDDRILVATARGAAGVASVPVGFELAMARPHLLPPEPVLDAILARLAAAPETAGGLIAAFPDVDPGQMRRGLAWLLKMGFAA